MKSTCQTWPNRLDTATTRPPGPRPPDHSIIRPFERHDSPTKGRRPRPQPVPIPKRSRRIGYWMDQTGSTNRAPAAPVLPIAPPGLPSAPPGLPNAGGLIFCHRIVRFSMATNDSPTADLPVVCQRRDLEFRRVFRHRQQRDRAQRSRVSGDDRLPERQTPDKPLAVQACQRPSTRHASPHLRFPTDDQLFARTPDVTF